MYTAEDVDVIFTAAGGSGQGVIEAATDLSDEAGRHLWAVGVDSDFVFELPAEQREHVLTSMLKRLDLGVERIVEEFQAGDLEVPGSLRLGLADEAVGYSTAGDHLSPATIAEVDGLAADIASGEITRLHHAHRRPPRAATCARGAGHAGEPRRARRGEPLLRGGGCR